MLWTRRSPREQPSQPNRRKAQDASAGSSRIARRLAVVIARKGRLPAFGRRATVDRGPDAPRAGWYVGAVTLIERSALLARLNAHAAAAHSGSGSVVLVGGEAGVGKTSLLRAFVAGEGERSRVLWGACEPFVTPEPLGPFRDMAAFAQTIAMRPHRADLLAALLDELRTPSTTVMVVDDAHWADDATLDAIRYLGRRVHATHGLLLISYREDEALVGSPLRAVIGDLATAPGSHRLHVAPLTVEAVAELAAGHAVEAGRLHAITGGNPFYVTEVLAAEGWTVPPTISDAVLVRASRLEPQARAVLEVVSLAPGGLEPAIAMDLSGGDGGALDACLDRGMLAMGAERLSFRHELARLAIEGSIPSSRRRRLHLEIGERLESLHDVDPSRLVHHADAGQDRSAVQRYAQLAAREASVRGAHRAAADHLERAVAAAESAGSTDLATLVSAWADERTLFDDPREVLAIRRRAYELCVERGDRLGQARELIEVARMTLRVGDPAASYRLSRDSIDLLEQLPPGSELAKAYAAAAYSAMSSFRIDEASRRAAAVIELEAQIAPSAATVTALRVKATIESRRGDTVEAVRTWERARRMAMAAGDLDLAVAVVIDTGLELLWTRQYGEASKVFEDAIQLGRGADLDVRVSYATSMLSRIHFEQGRWAEAERLATDLLREQRRHPATHVGTLTTLGRVKVRRADADAVATLTEALSITERGESDDLWDIAAGLAEAAWLNGRTAEIPAVVGDVYERARAKAGLFPPARWAAGELALWLWRAGAVVEPPSGIAEPYALQIAGEWRLAAAAWEQIGCPYEQSSALADGDEAAMRQALALFSRLGAEPAADRLRERMRQAGVSHLPGRPRRSTRGAPAQLTRRQLEILELLEGGLSNREIARRLFITEKTAGNHVSAILAKLDARSRSEAASLARRLGIVGSGA